MRVSSCKLLPIALTFMTTAPSWAADVPQAKVEYSADSRMETEGMVVKSRVYHALNKERVEMTHEGMKNIMIIRMDKKLTWVLMPDQKMYMEMNLEEGKKKSRDVSREMTDCKIEQKSVGSEVVNGIKTTKSRIAMACPDDRSYDGHMWVTRDGIMMRMETVAKGEEKSIRFKMELSNLKVARQDPKLFEVPAGYEKMTMGGLFGNIGNMLKNAQQGEERPARKSLSRPQPEGRSYTTRPREEGRSYTAAPRPEGRSYTATPRGEGRSYTAEPRSEGRSYTANPRKSKDAVGDTMDKVKRWMGF